MKRTLTVVLALMLVAAFAFALVACDDQPEAPGAETGTGTGTRNTAEPSGKPAEQYTITFDSRGGSAVAAMAAPAGESITSPAAPTKEGFLFSGWYESTDGGATLADHAFAFAYMPAKNVTLYAKWVAVTEIGKKYAVKNYKTDVRFEFDNPAMSPENLEDYQKAYSTMRILFQENHAVEIYLHAEMAKDDWHFYAVSSENTVEFFGTIEDAENRTNKLTEDYFGWSYQFDSGKKTLTVSARMEESKLTLTMILTVVD